MNKRIVAGLTVASAAVAVSSIAAPAQAFSFGNGGITFDTNTQVEFSFLTSQGAYKSSLGIYEVVGSTANMVQTLFYEAQPYDSTASDFKGTFGNAVKSSTGINSVVYTFQAGKTYTLGLASTFGKDFMGTVFSSNSLNPFGQQAKFSGDLASGSTVWFDDRGNKNDKDFNDFGVQAKAVPEPFTMGGLTLAGIGMAYARRRRSKA